MTRTTKVSSRLSLGTAIAAVLATSIPASLPTQAVAQSTAVRPSNNITLSVGTGRMVRLDSPITDIFVANESIADVQVRSANQIFIFGKGPGETTVFATDRAGRTVFSANVSVGTNIGSVDELLRVAMPDAQIQTRTVSGMVLLTGTVAAPADVEEAARLVQAFVGTGTQVISRLKTATPLQVMLQVKIAEVSRSLIRSIGVNLTSFDPTGGAFSGTIGRGRNFGEFDATGGITITSPEGVGTIGAVARNLLGVDVAAALDLNQTNGLVTTLAEPNLTALSGETASFLAGGEFPIVTSSDNGTSVEYKSYGVSLAFTPTVLEGGRISMRVRPEVSELTSQGAVRSGGIEIPALTTRRAETTVELGSGQSFMIGGLMQNGGNNSIERTPLLGSLPIIGALFRSKSFRRNETELVIIVTPYLVRPVNASEIALPTDGYRGTHSARSILLDKDENGRDGGARPLPRMAEPPAAPGMSGASNAPAPAAPLAQNPPKQVATRPDQPSASPGFSF